MPKLIEYGLNCFYMLRPNTTPEEQRFLQGLEQRDAPLFTDIMDIINSTRTRLSRIKTEKTARAILQESENQIRVLYPKYKGTKNRLFESDIQKADAIILRMVHEKIDQIRARILSRS